VVQGREALAISQISRQLYLTLQLRLGTDAMVSIIAKWDKSFREQYGGSLPDNYCAIDVETTGFDRKWDLIVEIGHCLVKDRKPVDKLSVVLDWTYRKDVDQTWLAERLCAVKAQIEEHPGQQFRVTPEVMRSHGMDPIEGLKFYHDFIRTLMNDDAFFLLHGHQFDESMMASTFRDYLGIEGFQFHESRVFDTGSIEKAGQAEHKLAPKAGESLRKYFRRVNVYRLKGARFKLSHCIRKYGLLDEVSAKDFHGAEFDSYCCHLLFEKQRRDSELIEEQRVEDVRRPLKKVYGNDSRKPRRLTGPPSYDSRKQPRRMN